ncbi:hypothetical protein RQP53_16785 [Paucibacter sp. APW11]|uniref:PH domain-containing protein n=1 Tax=Roseateles aquae TaxID=3077235 RepID=A0ABU3PEY2_9BURK|nr:DUF6683 family protein [Paucibacter sp. APW11]MDT9000935.1 hypothetical protein [Paucibacter sp. APW11]
MNASKADEHRGAWQSALALALQQALGGSRLAQTPYREPDSGWHGTRWLLPRRDGAEALSARCLGVLARAGLQLPENLARQCLSHFRHQLAPGPLDDLGLALAGFLGACWQAQDQLALTRERWAAITLWLEAWVIDSLPWDEASLAERQTLFERLAVLTAALGEWTLQASHEGGAAMESARWLARNSLQTVLGLELELLCTRLRSLDVSTAVNPSLPGGELGAAADRQLRSGPV